MQYNRLLDEISVGNPQKITSIIINSNQTDLIRYINPMNCLQPEASGGSMNQPMMNVRAWNDENGAIQWVNMALWVRAHTGSRLARGLEQ